jgi:pre-mRNA-splicing helicase BRR2
LGKILRKKVGRTYGELAKDSGILLAMDVILTTPEAWDAISRRWRARKGFDQIGLFVIENLHMLSEGLSTLEVVVSRMRYISSQMGEKSFRMIGLSTSVADYNELG